MARDDHYLFMESSNSVSALCSRSSITNCEKLKRNALKISVGTSLSKPHINDKRVHESVVTVTPRIGRGKSLILMNIVKKVIILTCAIDIRDYVTVVSNIYACANFLSSTLTNMR